MTDRPIIFSAPMVRALLDGRKTMTRRMAWRRTTKPALHTLASGTRFAATIWQEARPGDRLWVREAWVHYQTVNQRRLANGGYSDEISDGLAGYRADGFNTIEDFRQHVRLMSGTELIGVEINGNKWRPSIHMPRWASRLTLVVTAIRMERLRDLVPGDARAEGIGQIIEEQKLHSTMNEIAPITLFQEIWESLHGPGSWDANPEVCVISFTVHKVNIDSMAKAMERA